MKFSKDQILSEIRRTASANGGIPLGVGRFYAETGIKETDWRGRHWLRWGDALVEAGFSRNKLQEPYPDDFLLEKLAALVRELGHFPLTAELKMQRRADDDFPSWNVFTNRFGDKKRLAASLLAYCNGLTSFDDVARICEPFAAEASEGPIRPTAAGREEALGFVYLLKSGRYYKIGRSNAVGRREREIAIQMPEKANVVHSIKTDDPAGIEAYWHRRFEARRKGGEWFDLSTEEISIFKRRKFM